MAAVKLRVAFEGEHAAYSEEAIGILYPGAESVPSRTVLDVLRAVQRNEVDAGVVPIENTLAGSVDASIDALGECGDLHVVAETAIGIHHCLMAPAGATIEELEIVDSHPVALAQCTTFLRQYPRLRIRAVADTAGAARDVAIMGIKRRGAIASRAAAARYRLAILAEHVEDRSDNQTRFLAVGREQAVLDMGTPARTSVMFTLANEPGAMARVLAAIAERGVNVSRLDSRPTGEPWTYRFLIDVDHVVARGAIEALREATTSFRVLGTYGRAV